MTGSGTDTLTLKLNTPVTSSQNVTIQYDATVGDAADLATPPSTLASFPAQTVTNNVQ